MSTMTMETNYRLTQFQRACYTTNNTCNEKNRAIHDNEDQIKEVETKKNVLRNHATRKRGNEHAMQDMRNKCAWKQHATYKQLS